MNVILPGLVQQGLFATVLLLLALMQRRHWVAWGGLALVAEFGLLVAGSGISDTWVRTVLLLAYAVAFSLDFRFFDRLGWPLDKHILRFAMREPENTRLLLASEFGGRGWLVLAVTIVAALVTASAPAASGTMAPAGFAMVCLAVLAVAMIRGSGLPPVPNLARAILSLLDRTDARPGLGRPTRAPLPRNDGVSVPTLNILIVVCESLNRRVLREPEGRSATPRYHAFLAGEGDRLVEFPFALANSSSSDVAYVSMLTGLSPDATWERFHSNPLLWHAAKAKGYRTALFTSQSLRWRDLDRFLLDAALDQAVYREALGAPAVNDLAMDDRIVNRLAIDSLVGDEGPFCAVVNYNMLHAPFTSYAEPSSGADMTASERYRIALGLFDTCFGDLVAALSAAGKLADTAILFTSDHGELPERYDRAPNRRVPERLDDFDAEVLRIPFWLRLPDGEAASERGRQLRANANRVVANLDLYPTVLDLLGYEGATSARLADGRSLLEPVPDDRPLVMLNTGAFRQWALAPFAFTRDGLLLIFHDGSRRFELTRLRDPDGADLWPGLPASARAAWLGELAGYPALTDILVRRRLLSAPHAASSVARIYDDLAALGPDADLHVLNNWGLLSREDWEAMCLRTAEFIGVEAGDTVFEAGCGAGAFLDVLIRAFAIRATGVDMAERLIEIAGRRLPGDFRVADIRDLSDIEGGQYDKVVSHGVFLYLPSLADVGKAASELVRLVKPGGVVYIGVLNDPGRFAEYRTEHPPSGNTFIARGFWHHFAAVHDLEVEVMDQERIYRKVSGYDGHANLRYSVRLRKPGPSRLA